MVTKIIRDLSGRQRRPVLPAKSPVKLSVESPARSPARSPAISPATVCVASDDACDWRKD